MLDRLIALDHQLLLMLNGSDSVYWDRVMMTITHTTTWLFVGACLLLALARNNTRRAMLILIISVAVTILLSDQISSALCKPLFHRLRPSHQPAFGCAVDLVEGYRGGLSGFISSHAANTFGVAVFLSLVVRHALFAFTVVSWAALCSYSRIYLGVHYPADILCGAAVGSIIAVAVWMLARRVRYTFDGARPRYSLRYTSTGYLNADVVWVVASFFATYIIILIKSFL